MFWRRHRNQAHPYLGQLIQGRRVYGNIHAVSPKHVMTIGPPRSGKTAGLVIPNAHLRRGKVIIDTRGDIWATTHRLAEHIGKVLVLDAYNMRRRLGFDVASDGWN